MAQGTLLSPSAASTQAVFVSTPKSSEKEHRNRDAFRRKMVRSKTPPPRLSPGKEGNTMSPRRDRVNSRDYTHSYEGNYGSGNEDMVGVDLARTSGGWWKQHQLYIFVTYVVGVFLLEMFVAMLLSAVDEGLAKLSFTITNVIHFFVHLVYLHWLKGGYGELQGDLNAMTLWEQIEGTPGTMSIRFGLRFVPTVLCYSAVIAISWEPYLSAFNIVVWGLTLLGKFSFMNGVRILDINSDPVLDRKDD